MTNRTAATLVLVHGGTVTSTMWDSLFPYLTVPVVAVDLPGRRYRPADLATVTRADWAQAVVEEIDRRDLRDVVLVGHSSGGYVIPEVAALRPDRVRELVFVAATVPCDGAAPVEFIKPRLRDLAVEHAELIREQARGKTLGGLRPGEPAIETDLDVVENDPRMGLEAPGPLHEVYDGWSGVPDVIPRTYVRCLQDRVVTPELVARMLPNVRPTRLVDIDAGHAVADEAPAELAALLEDIATSLGAR
ncbi:MAG TPA: alpha/beta hydrolase [Mycobacteriales bacterium]|nr:alpha/beta hydrolase [Mycobacteriales bacterium]